MAERTANKITILRYRGYQLHVDDVTDQVSVVHLDRSAEPMVVQNLDLARTWIDQHVAARGKPETVDEPSTTAR